MPTNLGNFKEDEMIINLNNKKVSDLSNNLKSFIKALYGPVEEEEVISCIKAPEYIKPDFIVTYKGISKNISMKSGRAEVLHQEKVKTFVEFLKEERISKETIDTILLYHYGDGTTDGSGEERFEYSELRLRLDERIKSANAELNCDKRFVNKVMERFIVLGTLENAMPIDAIYYGDYEYGVVVTMNQLNKHLNLRSWKWMNNLHIGPIQLRPHARYINKEITNSYRRELMECYWKNLGADLDFISKRYDY